MGFRQWALQEDFRNWVINELENEIWLPLYMSGTQQDQPGKENKFIYSFLLKKENIEKELSTTGFKQYDGYPSMEQSNWGEQNEPGFKYYRFGQDNEEPLIYRRKFPTKPEYIEISQEFVHFFQLFHDKKNDNHILETADGNEEIVIKKTYEGWFVRSHRIKQYLAYKNGVLVVGISNRRFFDQEIAGVRKATNFNPLLLSKKSLWNLELWYQPSFGDSKYFSELFGKRIIQGIPIENTGIYPYEKLKIFETFIIKIGEDGTIIEHTCEPKTLANNFGKNPDSPHYLTPVYFSKDVLSKYYQQPDKYEVNDGDIRIGEYILRADTNHPDFVMVYLGDLGRDIPYSEQKYWKSKNISPESGMSKVNFERSILGIFADPEAPEFIFKYAYKNLKSEWKHSFGWNLLKELNKEDQYRLRSLRVPVTEDQQEFDSMVENLTIILVDSLNSREFNKILKKAGKLDKENKELPSIKKLDIVCQELGFNNFETNISFLHELYALRSRSSSHRKGSKEYLEVVEHFQIESKGFKNVFSGLLERATKFLEHFADIARQINNENNMSSYWDQ